MSDSLSSGAEAPAAEPRGEGSPAAVGKLVGWAALVGSLIALAYVGNATSDGPPDDDVLYRYSTAVAALVQYAVMAAIVAAISRGLTREALGFRAPRSWPRAIGLTFLGLFGIWAAAALLGLFLDAGEEQGLVPDSWDPSRAGPFIANFVVIAVVAPIVEETTYRGLGFAVVAGVFGPISAVFVTGIAFGLSHGLLVALPVLSLFGLILAELRRRTESVYPPMILHAMFNAAALLAAVTLGGRV